MRHYCGPLPARIGFASLSKPPPLPPPLLSLPPSLPSPPSSPSSPSPLPFLSPSSPVPLTRVEVVHQVLFELRLDGGLVRQHAQVMRQFVVGGDDDAQA